MFWRWWFRMVRYRLIISMFCSHCYFTRIDFKPMESIFSFSLSGILNLLLIVSVQRKLKNFGTVQTSGFCLPLDRGTDCHHISLNLHVLNGHLGIRVSAQLEFNREDALLHSGLTAQLMNLRTAIVNSLLLRRKIPR